VSTSTLEPTAEDYAVLAYGKHSLYDFTTAKVDVKDVLVEHYEGRHRPDSIEAPWSVYDLMFVTAVGI